MCRNVETGELPDDIVAALSSDLNTPLAISRLYALAKTSSANLRAALEFLGFELPSESQPEEFQTEAGDLLDKILDAIEEERTKKNYPKADKMRDEFEALGLIITSVGETKSFVQRNEILFSHTGSWDFAVHDAFLEEQAKALLSKYT